MFIYVLDNKCICKDFKILEIYIIFDIYIWSIKLLSLSVLYVKRFILEILIMFKWRLFI